MPESAQGVALRTGSYFLGYERDVALRLSDDEAACFVLFSIFSEILRNIV